VAESFSPCALPAGAGLEPVLLLRCTIRYRSSRGCDVSVVEQSRISSSKPSEGQSAA
jgi:hypothetical protein